MRCVVITLAVATSALSMLNPDRAHACTSILVSRGASTDGSTMLSYAADSHEFYGSLVYRPATRNPKGATVRVYEWDTGKLLGEIPEARETYAVVGNINEHQLSIAETTFGGRKELRDPTGTIDYGSLIYFTLQRAKTAREAIRVMTSLVAEHGYASSGESFSIVDSREAWILEMIGKGPARRGTVWVARRIPDGKISAHANHARIRQFPLDDPKNVLYAPDVIDFAREKGYFEGPDEAFSFADAYAPLDFGALRFCEARVWSVFRRAAPSLELSPDYVLAVPEAERLPLWVEPDEKLSVQDVMTLMRDHFEGTPFDLTEGVGAGPYNLPYRWRPLTWELDEQTYLNERAISTQQTGFSMVTQSRERLPDPIGGLMWFGVDDTYSTVYMPMYAGIQDVPAGLAPETADLHHFSWDSTFWVFNFVSNLAYSRYRDMIADIQVVQRKLEGDFLAKQAQVEQTARELYERSPGKAREYLTGYSLQQAQRVTKRWRRLGEQLLVKYMDGNVKDELGNVEHPPYPEHWYERIVAEAGDALRVVELDGQDASHELLSSGFFHSRAELGALHVDVPAEFPFDTHKLALVPGTSSCSRPPRCCAEAVVDPKSERFVVELPEEDEEEASKCGERGWLIRVPKNQHLPVYIERNGH